MIAWGTVRGKPSSSTPFLASDWLRRASIMRTTRSSGTSPPASMIGLASRPSAVSRATSSRSMSPAATCGMPRRTATRDAWVPLPLPGGPNINAIIGLSLDEPLVLAHQELRLDLFHGVEGNADHDQDRRAAQIEAGRRDAG